MRYTQYKPQHTCESIYMMNLVLVLLPDIFITYMFLVPHIRIFKQRCRENAYKWNFRVNSVQMLLQEKGWSFEKALYFHQPILVIKITLIFSRIPIIRRRQWWCLKITQKLKMSQEFFKEFTTRMSVIISPEFGESFFL